MNIEDDDEKLKENCRWFCNCECCDDGMCWNDEINPNIIQCNDVCDNWEEWMEN